jgi:hypothetical protein
LSNTRAQNGLRTELAILVQPYTILLSDAGATP